MTRVLLCYPLVFATNQSWVDSVEKTWAKAHPEDDFVVIPTWEDSSTRDTEAPDWPGLASRYDAIVAVEEFDAKSRKEVLDVRASGVVRAALVQGKVCWVYRRGTDVKAGMYRIADIREHDGQGRTRVLVRKRKRRKQP